MPGAIPPEPEALVESGAHLHRRGLDDRAHGQRDGQAMGGDRSTTGQPQRQCSQELVEWQHEPQEKRSLGHYHEPIPHFPRPSRSPIPARLDGPRQPHRPAPLLPIPQQTSHILDEFEHSDTTRILCRLGRLPPAVESHLHSSGFEPPRRDALDLALLLRCLSSLDGLRPQLCFFSLP